MTRREAPVSPPVVLTIAGSDSGGGAGIQADLKTIEAAGGFGTSAITSVTAQNTRGVEGSHLLPTADIRAQIEAVRDDMDVAAVKTGMLATADVIEVVAEYAADLPNLVVDPVMVAASGDRLLEVEAEDAYEQLIAEATLVTPNADEATVLTDIPIEDEESAVRAGSILVEDLGADAALVKGGHVPGETVRDVLVTADDVTEIHHARVDTDATHGSGCALSSAIATELAHGADLQAAVTAGIDLLGAAVRYNVEVGEGPGSVHHLVALRDDAAVGETMDDLRSIATDLGADVLAPIAGPGGVVAATATPYAEEPDDVLVLDVDHDDRGVERAIRSGSADRLGDAVLAAREWSPAVRFALACRHDDAIAAARERDGEGGLPTVVPAEEPDEVPIDRHVTSALETVTDPPVAVALSEAPGGPTTLLFARTATELRDRTRALAAAVR